MYNGDVGGVSGGNNNIKWSRELAEKLDAADGKKDGIIKKSVWDGFLKSVGSSGNTVKYGITLKNAAKSFEYYAKTKDANTVEWDEWESKLNEFIEKTQPSKIEKQPIETSSKSEETTSSVESKIKNNRAELNEKYVNELRKPWVEVTPVQTETAPVTGPSEGEDHLYDALVRGDGASVRSQEVSSAPVTGPSEGEDSLYDALVRGDDASVPAQEISSAPVPEPVEEVNPKNDVSVQVTQTPDKKQPAKTEDTPPQKPVDNFREANAPGVSIKYDIQPGENGAGFKLETNGKVSQINSEAYKYFSHVNITKKVVDNREVYTYRGLKAVSQRSLYRKIENAIITVSTQQAIYKDLLSKQNAGEELTNAEQSFMKSYLNLLDRHMLGLDENGNLIDKMK